MRAAERQLQAEEESHQPAPKRAHLDQLTTHKQERAVDDRTQRYRVTRRPDRSEHTVSQGGAGDASVPAQIEDAAEEEPGGYEPESK